MGQKKKGLEVGSEKATVELLKDLLIVELGKASVPQLEIRKKSCSSLMTVSSFFSTL